jgi:hypothetical protein
MEILRRLAELENQMKQLTGGPVQEAEKKEKLPEPLDPEVGDDAGEPVMPHDFEGKLSPEILERIYDGILTQLGELELEGQISPLDSPQKVREALLAVVRQLYIKKSMISKMGRKFARFGAKRFLRKQRTALGKAVSQG